MNKSIWIETLIKPKTDVMSGKVINKWLIGQFGQFVWLKLAVERDLVIYVTCKWTLGGFRDTTTDQDKIHTKY